MPDERLLADLHYSWQPFTLDGRHLAFADHATARLERGRCSSWGPAVYKWEGLLKAGPHAGRLGILIGETGDLRQRIKQYVSGTQERGNRLWRETFLKLGDIHLYVLHLESFVVDGQSLDLQALLSSSNLRLVLEQLLVMRALAHASDGTWIVNARR